MCSSSFFIFIIVISLFNQFNVSSYKILCAFPSISGSHFIVVDGLMKGLAEEGHDVTVLTPFPSKTTLKNYRQILIPETLDNFLPYLSKSSGSLFDSYRFYPVLIDLAVSGEENLLNEPTVQKMMREETFDLVIVEGLFGNALLGLGAHFKCPTATFVSFFPTPAMYSENGNPLALSYIAHTYLNYPGLPSFSTKVLSTLITIVDAVYLKVVAHVKHRNAYMKYFPSPTYPTYDEMLKNVSINFVATHFTEDNVRPLVPSTVEVGGIHINDKAHPLPDDLQKWMDNSTNGVIYFSLGSNMKSASLPANQLKEIVDVFRGLKENVLWKFEDETLTFLPKNVRIQKWMPQNDLLQHKNIKLFITHGGLGSITEAKFHGVPLIITPIYGDQMANAEKVVNRGWGIQLPFAEISGDTLTKTINTILSDRKYSNQAKYESLLYRDRQNTPLETGIYWVEYVIRHHGAKHLQSNALFLNFFQLHSLDVIGFLVFVFGVLVFSFYKLLSLACSKCKKQINKPKSE